MSAPPPDPFRTGPGTGRDTRTSSDPLAPPPGCPAHAARAAASAEAAAGAGNGAGTAGAMPLALYAPQATADPMAAYQWLRAEHGAIAPILLEGDVPAWLVLGYDEILQISRSPHCFTRDSRQWRDWQEGKIAGDAPILPMLGWVPDCRSQDGKEHQRLRGAVKDSLERFDRRGVRRHINRYADELVDNFAAAGRAELLAQFAQQLPMLVLTRLFGLSEEAGPRLVEASRQLIKGTEKAVVADRYILGTLRDLVARKNAEPGLDFPSWLLEHPARLTDAEVEHHLRLVLVAANETTTNLMASTLRMVLTDPRFRGTLRGGQMTLPAAVDQILWDEPPLMVCPARFASYDVELAGQPIRKGDLLLLGLAAGNADPAIRPAPDTPMYGNRSHLSFGTGPHQCPGQDIGRAIAGTGISALLKRLPDCRLVIEKEDLTWTSSTWSRHLDALPVEFTPRQCRPPAYGAGQRSKSSPESPALPVTPASLASPALLAPLASPASPLPSVPPVQSGLPPGPAATPAPGCPGSAPGDAAARPARARRVLRRGWKALLRRLFVR